MNHHHCSSVGLWSHETYYKQASNRLVLLCCSHIPCEDTKTFQFLAPRNSASHGAVLHSVPKPPLISCGICEACRGWMPGRTYACLAGRHKLPIVFVTKRRHLTKLVSFQQVDTSVTCGVYAVYRKLNGSHEFVQDRYTEQNQICNL
jgi:hypothetical protein